MPWVLTATTTTTPESAVEALMKQVADENSLEIRMAIPRKITFLEESRSRGISIYHSSGIEEDEIYSSGIRGISRN